jgi:hypothetical protein
MDYFYFVVDGFTPCAENFVSTIVGFAAMAENFVVAGYSFESAVKNTAILHNSIYAQCRWLRHRRILRGLASCVNFDSAIVSYIVAVDCRHSVV